MLQKGMGVSVSVAAVLTSGGNAIFFSVKAEATEISTAISWLHKLLYRTVLDPAVLKVQAA
jgi:hypothetical protein